jgi:arsenate reductase
MADIKIYHKTNCATSLAAYSLLKKKKVKMEVVEYLVNPPSTKELKEILKMLGIKAEQLVRKKESLYKEKFAAKKYTEAQWIKIICENPILMERPIIVKGNKAIIGRPPEKVLELI